MARVKAPKQPTKTQRLRRNVSRQIRSLEKREYIVPEEVKENLKTAKYSTLKSYQKDNYKRLYRESYGYVQGKQVTGLEKRSFERSVSAKKGAQTRRSKLHFKDRVWTEKEEHDYTYAEEDMRNGYNAEGEIMYRRLHQIIDESDAVGAYYLKGLLIDEERKYGGHKAFIIYLSHVSEDLIYEAQKLASMGSPDFRGNRHLPVAQAIRDIITGTIETVKEAKEFGNVLNAMEEDTPEGFFEGVNDFIDSLGDYGM